MYLKSQLLALALSVATSEAAHKGFNYGATNTDGSVRSQADFKSQFSAAKSLAGASDFTSARLYTMIQGGTTNSPIEAIPAAIEEETSLLLGLWASGGGIDNEIAALKAAINQYGDKFAKLVVGISVGSEDLYRNSVAGARSPEAGPGVDPKELVKHIQDVRAAIKGTGLSDALIGHVDTWDAWTNGSNSDVVNHLDWLGFDGYPYYQNSMPNSIENAKSLFYDAVDKTKSAARGKPVWITETGWPVSGDKENEAVASVANAKTFWDEVGCSLFDNTNTWWYILQDVGASPSFGIVGQSLTDKPLFDLKCPSSSSSSSSTEPSSTGKTNSSRNSVPSASASSGSDATSAGSSGSASAGPSAAPSAGPSVAATHSVSGFASKQVSASGKPSASGSSTSKVSTPATSTPLASSTKGAGSGSGSGSSSNGGSGSSSSNGSASSSGSAASASSSLPASGADRPASSIFGAVAAFLALAIAV